MIKPHLVNKLSQFVRRPSKLMTPYLKGQQLRQKSLYSKNSSTSKSYENLDNSLNKNFIKTLNTKYCQPFDNHISGRISEDEFE